jgi:hypothetical protein
MFIFKARFTDELKYKILEKRLFFVNSVFILDLFKNLLIDEHTLPRPNKSGLGGVGNVSFQKEIQNFPFLIHLIIIMTTRIALFID